MHTEINSKLKIKAGTRENLFKKKTDEKLLKGDKKKESKELNKACI